MILLFILKANNMKSEEISYHLCNCTDKLKLKLMNTEIKMDGNRFYFPVSNLIVMEDSYTITMSELKLSTVLSTIILQLNGKETSVKLFFKEQGYVDKILLAGIENFLLV